MNRVLMTCICSASVLCGCVQVLPSEPFFAEFHHDQTDVGHGVLHFSRSTQWQENEKRFGFKVDGWTVGSIGLDCQNKTMHEIPVRYRIDRRDRYIEFGQRTKTRCYFQTQDSARFVIYPVIVSRSLFDPGELAGAETFTVDFELRIR